MNKLQTAASPDMITLGVDMASQKANTAACRIDWINNKPPEITITEKCDDGMLQSLIKACKAAPNIKAAIGIDAPFGWPTEFTKAVQEWRSDVWTDDLSKVLRLWLTDAAVKTHQKSLRPQENASTVLSVSSDRIALPAMRTMALLKWHQVTDRSGEDDGFYEVYPAGSLQCWGMPSQKYKGKDGGGVRSRIIQHLQAELWLDEGSKEQCLKSDHCLDALIASLTARLAALGNTALPTEEQKKAARSEGWIHLPKDSEFISASFQTIQPNAPALPC